MDTLTHPAPPFILVITIYRPEQESRKEAAMMIVFANITPVLRPTAFRLPA